MAQTFDRNLMWQCACGYRSFNHYIVCMTCGRDRPAPPPEPKPAPVSDEQSLDPSWGEAWQPGNDAA